jgi:hypothetical protein
LLASFERRAARRFLLAALIEIDSNQDNDKERKQMKFDEGSPYD